MVKSYLNKTATKRFLNGEFNWEKNNVRVLLCKTLDKNAEYESELRDEVVGVGYATGGKYLVHKSIVDFDNKCCFMAENVNWKNSTIEARYAVLVSDRGEPYQNDIIAYVDFGDNFRTNDGNFKIIWDENGVMSLDFNPTDKIDCIKLYCENFNVNDVVYKSKGL